MCISCGRGAMKNSNNSTMKLTAEARTQSTRSLLCSLPEDDDTRSSATMKTSKNHHSRRLFGVKHNVESFHDSLNNDSVSSTSGHRRKSGAIRGLLHSFTRESSFGKLRNADKQEEDDILNDSFGDVLKAGGHVYDEDPSITSATTESALDDSQAPLKDYIRGVARKATDRTSLRVASDTIATAEKAPRLARGGVSEPVPVTLNRSEPVRWVTGSGDTSLYVELNISVNS